MYLEIYGTNMMQTFLSENINSWMFSEYYIFYDKQDIAYCMNDYYAIVSMLYDILILYPYDNRLPCFATCTFPPLEN